MKSQTLVLLLVAAGCGLVAMLGVQRVLSNKGTNEVETVEVLVAATPLAVGDPLDELNTRFLKINKDACPEGVVTSLEMIQERALKVQASPGDFILVGKLTEPGETGAVANIPVGMRVATIPVDATKSHSGMLRPGNRVDVLMTHQETDNQGQRRQKVQTLLQYIEIFAVDDKVYGTDKDGGGNAKNISLLVTPEQAALLELAEKKGDLSTTLRSTQDTDEVSTVELSEETLQQFGLGGGVDTTSVMDIRDDFSEEPGFVLPTEDQPTVMNQLQTEFAMGGPGQPFASGPMGNQVPEPPARNVWKIAIHEKGQVRVEEVDLDSDEPIDTRDQNSSQPDALPSAGNLDDVVKGGTDSSDFEDAASGLLDLFNSF